MIGYEERDFLARATNYTQQETKDYMKGRFDQAMFWFVDSNNESIPNDLLKLFPRSIPLNPFLSKLS
jgi:hypothetical protein